MFCLTSNKIEIEALQASVSDPAHGATLLFLGIARNHFEGRPVSQLEYEAYDEMAIPAMKAIASAVDERWPGTKTSIVHRIGPVPNEEIAVVIATSTPHRAACYDANRFAIEELKRTLPVWKKEIYTDGSEWKANNA